MDGKVIIGTELDSKQLDKDLKDERAKLNQFEKENQVLIRAKGKAESELKEYYKLRDAIKQATDNKMQMADEEELIAKYLAKEEEQLNNLNEAYSKQLLNLDEINKKIQENELQQGLVRNNIDTINQKLESTKKIDNINQSIKNIGNSIGNVVKKITRWGLAIFGIRSAYLAIRQAMSTLSGYNEKMATDLQYIRFAIATTLQPIIEKIIELAYKLLAYIGYIAKAWFGVNIFANASVKAFQKVNKGVKDTNKSAQKLQKTLAGFDEMNILQENGSVGTGGGGGGITTPSMDLANLENIEMPGWIEWIATHKDVILNALKEIGIMIGVAFAIKKILDFADGINKLSNLLTGMSNLQIFGLITGIALTIWGIIETIQALTSENVHLEEVLSSVSDAIIGIGLITASFNPWGWVVVGVGLLGNLISAFIDTRTDAEKLEEANKNLEEAQRGVNDAYQDYVNASKTHLNAYKNVEKAQKNLKDVAKKLGITTDELTKRGQDLYEEIREHPEKISELSDKDKLLYEAYLNVIDAEARLKTSEDKLITTEEKLTEAQQNEIIKQLDKQKVLADSTGKYEEYRDAVIDAYEQGALSGEEATGRISEALAKTDKESKQVFVDGIPGYIQDMMNTFQKSVGGLGTKWRSATDDMKIYADSLAGKFNSKFGTDIPKSVQKSVDKVKTLMNLLNKLPFGKSFAIKVTSALGGNFNAKGAIYYPPKLAVGGIINQPGRGVPLAMGGERGAEGVIPLTDSQQMQRLGEAIGRYITVNANIVNTMNGRVISRELKQIENDENFAFNGG